ncbi:hypothetical protein [Planktothrix agardhii]|nr:hypothetical protein [Planktothrix agardhii]
MILEDKRAIAFRLQENGKYKEINTSIALNGIADRFIRINLRTIRKNQ